ncbi:hypothetical protein BJX63DRAFT_214835 [Aspergillus granulosus]|uniref:Nucleoside phosphorylase domain-containing protein n=1 Tax=Aspergillus granulosus TaxID=176169 RepID=A0ABR4HFJ0_9EURO
MALAMPSPTTASYESYSVAWICALPLELAAATVTLDRIHTQLSQPSIDDNSYVLGEIQGHNVVVTCLPSGIYGTVSATAVVSRLRSTFPAIKYSLMVGIGGGVPTTGTDVRLGDVVVSKPSGRFPGVIQYDLGKTVAGGKFEQSGFLNQPPQALLTSIAKLQSKELVRKSHSISTIVRDILAANPEMKEGFASPGPDNDHLFEASYNHCSNEKDCRKCDPGLLVTREPRRGIEPMVHYGLIASGDQVMKDSQTRDRLTQGTQILCFEMEAAGIMNVLPCLVIRGICDYCDSHKNDHWQGYASLTAAAYAKLLLCSIPVPETPLVRRGTWGLGEEYNLGKFRIESLVPADTDPVPTKVVEPFIQGPFDLVSRTFIGRREEMRTLNEWLKSSVDDPVARYLIHGMPGVGKSQLSLQLAKSAFDSKHVGYVLWMSASTVEKVNQGLTSLANTIGGFDLFPSEQSSAISVARYWLQHSHESTPERWLIVFDNVDLETSEYLRKILPDTHPGGAMILTSRYDNIAANFTSPKQQKQIQALHMMPFAEDEAAELLLCIAGTNETTNEITDSKVKQLVNLVGRLPLAIDQAGAFMRLGYDAQDLLRLYRENDRFQILEWENQLSVYESKSVSAAFALAFREVQKGPPENLQLLYVLSFLDPDGVPCKMLEDGASQASKAVANPPGRLNRSNTTGFIHTIRQTVRTYSWPTWSAMADQAASQSFSPEAPEMKSFISMAVSPVRLQKAVQKLQSLSLVTRQSSPNVGLLRMHDVVQLLIRTALMDKVTRSFWLCVSIHIVCSAFKQVKDPSSPRSWNTCEAFVRQIQALSNHSVQFDLLNAELLRAQAANAVYFESRGQFTEAEPLYLKLYYHYKENCGDTHLDTLDSAAGLARARAHQNRLEDAQLLFDFVYQNTEKRFGKKHRYTLRALENLASVTTSLGQVEIAERLCRRALEGHETRPDGGPNHPDTLLAARTLAVLYTSMGKHEDAEVLFKGIVESFQNLEGENSAHTLSAVHDLAYTLYRKQQYQDAEALFKRAWSGKAQLLGECHPDTLMAEQNLALVLCLNGEYGRAEQLCLHAYQNTERALGASHASTLRAMQTMAQICCSQGRTRDAELLLERVLEGRKQTGDSSYALTEKKLAYLRLNGTLNVTDFQ